ncbi:UNVERIFIED_CONTAM: hypothetical protein Sangu_2563500 [Sesamum angustifolium]|uniref:Uncharacterized protein n=1 Tax=Sesamum angustifolium TaxID=2727405 RepID=A0AAW2J8Q3_9LAMI
MFLRDKGHARPLPPPGVLQPVFSFRNKEADRISWSRSWPWLASGQTVGKWAGGSIATGVSPQTMEQEMLSLVVNGRDSNATFDQFPYYLSEQTRVLLTSAAFVHLKKADYSKHTRNLSPASRTILLSGPTGTLRRQSSGIDLISSGQEGSNPAKLRRNASAANINNLASMNTPPTSVSCCLSFFRIPFLNLKSQLLSSSYAHKQLVFDDKLFIQTLYKVAASFAAEGSIMGELKQWNDLYGEGGSRKKEQLSYFL